jgi:hypothetical protein
MSRPADVLILPRVTPQPIQSGYWHLKVLLRLGGSSRGWLCMPAVPASDPIQLVCSWRFLVDSPPASCRRALCGYSLSHHSLGGVRLAAAAWGRPVRGLALQVSCFLFVVVVVVVAGTALTDTYTPIFCWDNAGYCRGIAGP